MDGTADLRAATGAGAPERARTARLAMAAMLGVTFVWGSTFVVVQDAIAALPVSSFLLWRFALAAGVMLALRPAAVRDLPPQLLRRGAAAGLVLGTGYLLQTVGLQHTSAAVSGFITGLFVVFTPLVSAVALRTRVPASMWGAVGLAGGGLALLALQGWSLGPGELVTLLGAVVYAVHLVLLGRWSQAEHAYGLTVVQLGAVAVMCAALALSDGGPVAPPSASVWAEIVFLAVLGTAVAFLVQTWAQAHLPATRTAVVMTTEPVWAAVIGVTVAGDPFTARMALGAALVLAAMYLVELGPRRGRRGTSHVPPSAPPLPHLEP